MCRNNMEEKTIPIYDPEDDVVPAEECDHEINTWESSSISEHGRVLFAFRRQMTSMSSSMMSLPTIASRTSKSAGIFKFFLAGSLLVLLACFTAPPEPQVVRLAMVGNSLMYYNDLPRVLEAMGKGKLIQNSCLHGNADYSSHLWYGNGMYDKWKTGQARIWDIEDVEIYDFGACSVQQLLFGKDERLQKRRRQRQILRFLESENYNTSSSTTDDNFDYNASAADAWKYELMDDETNPCLVDDDYNDYTEALYEVKGRPQWDYVLFNDNTRSPCCTEQRAEGMQLLEEVYLPWLRQINAAPIFMDTYGYWAEGRDMSGLTDIPTFTSLTYNGYQDYAALAERTLPSWLKPKIAPVGLAFLLVYEENPSMWADLMHNDQIHLSPSGTFLEALIVHATVFGKLPDTNIFAGREGPDRLWRWARRMAPVEHQYKPYPSVATCHYLYHIAHRIMVLGEVPRTLILYPANTSVLFTPDDTLYSDNAEHNGVS